MNINIKAELCPNCQTGAYSYELDNKSFACPYLYLHTGHECINFKSIKKSGGVYETKSSR